MSSIHQDHEGTYSRGVVGTTTAPEDPQDEKRRLAAAHTRRAHAARVLAARQLVEGVAMALAEHGLSAETIAEAMADMAQTASEKAAKYIAEYDREEQAEVRVPCVTPVRCGWCVACQEVGRR